MNSVLQIANKSLKNINKSTQMKTIHKYMNLFEEFGVNSEENYKNIQRFRKSNL